MQRAGESPAPFATKQPKGENITEVIKMVLSYKVFREMGIDLDKYFFSDKRNGKVVNIIGVKARVAQDRDRLIPILEKNIPSLVHTIENLNTGEIKKDVMPFAYYIYKTFYPIR